MKTNNWEKNVIWRNEMQKEPTFEEALDKLQEIVSSLETGQLSLDESLAKFEEGIRLSRFCNEKLTETQKKVQKLVEKDEKIQTEPFVKE
jgi:exodeoxyribonuclease VII small subunit